MMTVKFSTNFVPPLPGFMDRVKVRFSARCNQILVEAGQAILGTEEIYHLKGKYGAAKQKLPGFRRVPGKPEDQPLIFSGEMYDSLEAFFDGHQVVFRLRPGAAIDEGVDYGAKWEEETEFLEKGADNVLGELADALIEIITEEMFP